MADGRARLQASPDQVVEPVLADGVEVADPRGMAPDTPGRIVG